MDYAISTLVHEVSNMYRMIPAPLIAMQRLGIDIANEWSVFHGKNTAHATISSDLECVKMVKPDQTDRSRPSSIAQDAYADASRSHGDYSFRDSPIGSRSACNIAASQDRLTLPSSAKRRYYVGQPKQTFQCWKASSLLNETHA
jgi:hypothetical protein